jgi:hypothetical protein
MGRSQNHRVTCQAEIVLVLFYRCSFHLVLRASWEMKYLWLQLSYTYGGLGVALYEYYTLCVVLLIEILFYSVKIGLITTFEPNIYENCRKLSSFFLD